MKRNPEDHSRVFHSFHSESKPCEVESVAGGVALQEVFERSRPSFFLVGGWDSWLQSVSTDYFERK